MFVSALIDRQLGLRSTFYYDTILQRLVVKKFDSYLGICPNEDRLDFNPFPPLFACRFAEKKSYQHFLALANEDGKVAIQNTMISEKNDGEQAAFNGFQCHVNAVFDLVWMPGYMRFVTVSGDHSAKLWDIESGTISHVMSFNAHTRSVRTAAFRPEDSSVVATGARDGSILIWDTRCSNYTNVITKPDNCIYNCHPVVAPKTPGSGSKRYAKVTDRANSVTGLVFQDDFNLISCGSGDGSIRVWDLRRNYSNYKKDPLPKHSISYCGSSSKNGYSNLLLDKSRMTLFASCVDNVIYSFNIATENVTPMQKYIGHENGSFYIKSSLSPDSKYLVSGSSDYNAYIWNVRYSEPIVKLTGHNAEVTCATWCQVGDVKIVTCSDDARHKIWRIGNEVIGENESCELFGSAFEIPPIDKSCKSHLDSLDRTPQPLKRKIVEPESGSSKKSRDVESRPEMIDNTYSQNKRKTKRSLIEMMNNSLSLPSTSSSHYEPSAKRLNMDLESKGDFVTIRSSGLPSIPENSVLLSPDASKANESFTTPTKSSASLYYYSPTRVYNSPTANLPNFAVDGKAPHLRTFSPLKKTGNIDWLTKIRLNKSQRSMALNDQSCSREQGESHRIDESQKRDKTLLSFFSAVHNDDDNNSPLVDKTNKLHQAIKRKLTEACEYDAKCKVTIVSESEKIVASPRTSKSNKDKLQKNITGRTILSYFTVNNNDRENDNT